MAENEKPAEVWPFHKSILLAIRNEDLDPEGWLWLIRRTLIPAGHDAILEAMDEAEINSCWDEEVVLAKQHVLEQKRLAEEKAQQRLLEEIEMLRALEAALAAIVGDDDSATPPEETETAMGGASVGSDELTGKERLERQLLAISDEFS